MWHHAGDDEYEEVVWSDGPLIEFGPPDITEERLGGRVQKNFRLWYETRTEILVDGREMDPWTTVVTLPVNEVPEDGVRYSERYEYRPVNRTTVKMQDLYEAVNSALEGDNHHRSIGVLDNIFAVVEETCGIEHARAALVNVLEENGLLGWYTRNLR